MTESPVEDSTPAAAPLVVLSNVNKHYGALHVLQDIDLEIRQGEVVVLIGPSGSGKSTLCRTINRLETIDSGTITLSGRPLPAEGRELAKLRAEVGMVFQSFNLFPHLTVLENCMLAPLKVRGVTKDEAKATAIRYLERVRIPEQADKYPGQLSGGQQQRVAIARSLAMAPKVLLCDEITSALDPELVQEVLSVVRQLAEEGMTLILVTHEMRFAREVCDRLVFMHGGRIIEQGPPAELFDRPSTPELAQFIGMVEAR